MLFSSSLFFRLVLVVWSSLDALEYLCKVHLKKLKKFCYISAIAISVTVSFSTDFSSNASSFFCGIFLVRQYFFSMCFHMSSNTTIIHARLVRTKRPCCFKVIYSRIPSQFQETSFNGVFPRRKAALAGQSRKSTRNKSYLSTRIPWRGTKYTTY